MNEFLGGLDCKLRLSGMVADSIMMGIVHSSMEQAFNKACSKEGVLERLNEKSRFCELAVMQLDWCLKFVQEETNKFVLLETSCERQKLVSDLTETRDRIQHRLHETEFAIWNKDREFSDTQCKLREILGARENQDLWSLTEEVEARSKSKADGGHFCELKNSVDQQFFNIKQKLEDEKINFTIGVRNMGHELAATDPADSPQDDADTGTGTAGGVKNTDGEHHPPTTNQSLSRELSTGIEKMGSDIDILKETLDVAFGMMSNAIALAEVGPIEQRWRWEVEKDIMGVVVKGFFREIKQGVKPKRTGRSICGSQVSLGEDWSQLMDEIGNLRRDLDQLINRYRDRSKTITRRHSISSSTVDDVETNTIPRRHSISTSPINDVERNTITRRHSISSASINYVESNAPIYIETICSIPTTPVDEPDESGNTFSKSEEQNHPEDPQGNPVGQGSLVAKMIKNHESIIRQKSEELNWLKGEILKEKGNSTVKKDKESYSLKKRIQDIITRLDRIIIGNLKLDTRCDHENDSITIGEHEDSHLRCVVTDDIITLVLKHSVKNYHSDLYDEAATRITMEDVCQVFFREFLKEWKHKIANLNIHGHIREEMFYFICNEAVKDFHYDLTLKECFVGGHQHQIEEFPSSDQLESLERVIEHDVEFIVLHKMVREWGNYLERSNTENLIREDVQTVVLSEMLKELGNFLERSNFENLIREEVFNIVIRSATSSINCTCSCSPNKYQTAMLEGNLLGPSSFYHTKDDKLEYILQGDVYFTFLKEMVKEWKKVVQGDKNVCLGRNQENSEKVLESSSIPPRLQFCEKDNLMQTLESLSNCFQVEENLMLSARSELMRQNAHIDLFDLEHEKPDKENVYGKGLLIMKDMTLGSVNNYIDMAVQHIVLSKAQLKELRYCLGLAVGNLNEGCDQISSAEAELEEKRDSLSCMEKEKELQRNLLTSALSTFTNFSNTVVDFEFNVHEKIGFNVSRLEELERQLGFSVEHVNSIRKNEFLYKKAFLIRCYNLQKAEKEVDLLADELDGLLILLEKIYTTLDHYSPVLQQYFRVEDILQLIRKELNRPAVRRIQ